MSTRCRRHGGQRLVSLAMARIGDGHGWRSLPCDLFREILGYLSLHDLSNIDRSLINHLYRSFFLFAMNGVVIFHYFTPSANDSDLMTWMMKRNIYISELCLQEYSSSFTPFILHTKSKLIYLRISTSDQRNEMLANCFNQLDRCPKLTYFSTQATLDISEKMMMQFLSNNPQLESLSLTGMSHFTPEIIMSICQYCSNIKHLSLSMCSWCNDDCIYDLINSNLNLHTLDLSSTEVCQESTIEALLSRFSNLHELSIHDCSLSYDVVRKILRDVALPAILNPDPEIQFFGLCCATNNIDEVCYTFHISHSISLES